LSADEKKPGVHTAANTTSRAVIAKRISGAIVHRASCATQKNFLNVFPHDKNFSHRKTSNTMSKNPDALVDHIMDATNRLADAVAHEQALEDNRINVKLAAIDRIMAAGDNQFTGKPHSFSSAENIVNTDPEYQNYLEQQRDAVRTRILARGAYEAALAAASLETAAKV